MNNIKCLECGLVNWSTDVECKRCGSLLTTQEKRAQARTMMQALEPPPLLNKFLKGLLIALGAVTLLTIFSRGFQLLSADLAVMIVLPIMLVASLLYFGTQVLLLVRIFQQSIGWGLGTLFIPFVAIIAIIKFWEHTKRSFIGSLLCTAIIIMGLIMTPFAPKHRLPATQSDQGQTVQATYR